MLCNVFGFHFSDVCYFIHRERDNASFPEVQFGQLSDAIVYVHFVFLGVVFDVHLILVFLCVTCYGLRYAVRVAHIFKCAFDLVLCNVFGFHFSDVCYFIHRERDNASFPEVQFGQLSDAIVYVHFVFLGVVFDVQAFDVVYLD